MNAGCRLWAFGAVLVLAAEAVAAFDVRDFGAKGDGVTKDTAAIQRAVDAANAAGGGTVALPEGTYVSGTVYLKSNVEFGLARGAVLKASADRADYCAAEAFAQNYASAADNTSGGHLLVAVCCTNVTVRGPGTIDGNSAAFLVDPKTGRPYEGWKRGIPWRPGQMVYVVDSRIVRFEGVNLVNSPYWSCFILNCDVVTVRDCTIRTERKRYRTWNGDGLDIDRCSNVCVTGCDIDTEDDSITLRASSAARLASPQDCHGVMVRDCKLSSACNAIRVGVGEGVVRDCSLANLSITNTRKAICLVSSYSKGSRGVDIHDIRFSDIDVDCETLADIRYRHATETEIRDITFSNIRGAAKKPNEIEDGLKGIVFDACQVRVGGGADRLEIGWGETDITPPLNKRVPLMGQYYQRLADEKNPIHSRLKFVALAMRRGDRQVLMGCIDNVGVWPPFLDRVRARLHELDPQIATNSVYMGSIHTHSAPGIRGSGTPQAAEFARKNPNVLGYDEYADFALDRVVDAYMTAWRGLKPGGVRTAFGQARVGHCRLAKYADGSAEMYGDSRRPDFVGMMEGEDDGVEMLFTVDEMGRKTGLLLNVACPAQVLEANYQVSSDFAGATREKLKGVYGADFKMLYQIGAAGCQAPRDLVRRDRTEPDGWHEDTVEVLSDRLVACVKAARPSPATYDVPLSHECLNLKLPMRRVTPAQVAAAEKELAELSAKWPGDSAWQDFLAQVHANEAKGGPGPYDSKLHPYAVMDVDKAVIRRAAEQDSIRVADIEVHVTRIGDIAIVTCPFELYLAYGQTIKARSVAKQTFVVTKCGNSGYLPTKISEESVGYSGGINVGKIGHEGGFMLCDKAVEAIKRSFDK